MEHYIGITRKEIQELTETILNNYFKATSTIYVGRIDIVKLADYLRLPLVYVNINEDDKNKLAVISDGVRPIRIVENGIPCRKVFPKNTILLDNYLKQPDLEAKRRYTISHEMGHYLLTLYGYAPVEAAFSCEFDPGRDYSYAELHDMLRLNESQANEVGAFLLMPLFLLKRYVKDEFRAERVPVYGRYLMRQETKLKIKKIADDLGVSFSALMIQLKQLHLIDYHEPEEFLMEVEM